MSVGVGVGGLIAPALTSGVLIPLLGWRTAYLGLGIIAFVITFPIAFLVIKPNPYKQTHCLNTGEKEQSISTSKSESNSYRKRYIFSPLLWLIAISFLFSQFGLTGTLQNQVPHMTDAGFSPIVAASVLGMIGLFSSFGKLFFGWLCDFVQVRYAFILSLLLQASGTSILLALTPDTPIVAIWIYAFSIGIGGGTWLPIMSMYINRSFPIQHYGTLFGIVNFCFSIGVACGPLFAGFLFDIYGSYNMAFKIFLGCYVAAIIMGFFSKSDTKEGRLKQLKTAPLHAPHRPD
jgi:MFS family permease